MNGEVRKLDGRERRDRDDDRYGENVPDRQRYDRANDGDRAALKSIATAKSQPIPGLRP